MSLLEFKTETGESLLVEVAEPPGGAITRGGRTAEVVVEAGASLEQVLGRLGPALKGDRVSDPRGRTSGSR